MNNEKQEVLTIFMEECAEATVEASKIIRFGYDNNVPTLENEIGDVLCMVKLLEEYGIIDMENVQPRIAAKREKLKKWSDLSVLSNAVSETN